MGKTLNLTPELVGYVQDVGVREHPALAACREATRRDRSDRAVMQIAPEQGAFLSMLVRLVGAEQILEVGVFTGYSAMAMAQALPSNGRLVACDISEDFARDARRHWKAGGVADRIELRIGDAAETLTHLLDEQGPASFDLAFIDADKTGYDLYYERCLELLRPGGLIAFDNVLWGGSVIDPSNTSEDTVALRGLNQKLRDDQRVDISLVTVGDGLYLARKR